MTWPRNDPAIEAAERATQPRSIPWAVGPGRYALHGAREALAPIRDLHRPARESAWTVCAHCSAGASFVRWPCATAHLAYTTDELENTALLAYTDRELEAHQ